jgi:acetylornithine deacetylase
MQSGVAAMIYAVHAVQRAGYRICSPLTIQAVVEEECSGNGALACLQQGHTGDFVLIPEPFGARIYTGQIGVLLFKVSVQGVPAHVLATSQGSNAIETLWRVVPALKALERRLNEDYRTAPYDTIAQPYCLNIGTISGGNWPSSVPASAQLEGRIGFPLCLSVEEMMRRVQETVEQALNDGASASASRAQPAVSFHGFRSAGHLVDLQHPGIDMLSACHRSVTGRDIEHYLSTCTTDLHAFHHHGRTAGTCYGPEARNIHGVDECVNLASVLLTMQTYATFISRWCTLERV